MTREEKYECASFVLVAIQHCNDAIRQAKRCQKSKGLVTRLERSKELLLSIRQRELGAAGLP